MDYNKVPTEPGRTTNDKAAEAGEDIPPTLIVSPPKIKLRIYLTICVYVGYFMSVSRIDLFLDFISFAKTPAYIIIL